MFIREGNKKTETFGRNHTSRPTFIGEGKEASTGIREKPIC